MGLGGHAKSLLVGSCDAMHEAMAGPADPCTYTSPLIDLDDYLPGFEVLDASASRHHVLGNRSALAADPRADMDDISRLGRLSCRDSV